MIPVDRLIATIHAHWAAVQPLEAPTLFPGLRLNTDSAALWFELWVEAWSAPLRRSSAPDELAVTVVVHGFSRHPVQKFGVHRLADAARQTLAGRQLPILESADPGAPQIGLLSIREHTVQDFTRTQANQGHERLQHVVVAFDARARALPAASP